MLQLSLKKTLRYQVSPEVKKLVLFLATFTSVTGSREEMVETAEAVETTKVSEDGNKSEGECPNFIWVPCIWYPITFCKNSMPMSALLDSGSEVNAIYPIFARELGLPIRTTDVGTQKIDSTMRDTFEIVVVAFSVTDKANWVRFLEETFLVANVSLEVVFEILFLTLSGANVNFLGQELR